MVKVAVITSGLMFGGGQQAALGLVDRASRSRRLDAGLVLLGCRDPLLGEKAVGSIPYDGRYNRLGGLWRVGSRLRRVLRTLMPDIVHSHSWDADMATALATVGTPIPHILHLHVAPEWLRSHRFRHVVRRALTRWMLRRSRATVIAVSNAVLRHWAGLLPLCAEQAQVIHNGVDTEVFRPSPGGHQPSSRDFVIGTAARLVPGKGVEHLLDAVGRLVDYGHRPCLRIAGDGVLRSELELRAKALGISDQTDFLGQASDMPGFYRAIDVFALPSLAEGFPIALLEAMASGCAVVSTDVSGVPEAVRDGREALLVPPSAPEALAGALRRVLEDRELCRHLAASALVRVRNRFDLESSASKVFDLYDEILSGGVLRSA